MNTTASSHDTSSSDLAAALSALKGGGIAFSEVAGCPAVACTICAGAARDPLPQAA